MPENLAASTPPDDAPLDRWPGIAALALIVGTLLLAVRPPAAVTPPADTAPAASQPARPVTADAAATGTAQTPATAANATSSSPAAAPAAPALPPERRAAARRAGPWPVPRTVKALADQVLASADNEHRPFVIIDKRNARVHAVGADGRLIGSAPVLLGAARGDESVPGIGERPIKLIQPFERTTPAGRFVAASGVNTRGEDIVWVDYDAAISMHRVRVVDPKERRLARLASPSPADNRISYGCINLPVAFYEGVIAPMFRRGEHAVYVLPEVKPVQQVFAFARGTPVASGRHEHQAQSND